MLFDDKPDLCFNELERLVILFLPLLLSCEFETYLLPCVLPRELFIIFNELNINLSIIILSNRQSASNNIGILSIKKVNFLLLNLSAKCFFIFRNMPLFSELISIFP